MKSSVDDDGTASGEAQRRHHEITGPAVSAARVIERAKDKDLMGEFVSAFKAHMPVFVIIRRQLRPISLHRRRNRRRGDARGNFGDQSFFPGEAIELP